MGRSNKNRNSKTRFKDDFFANWQLHSAIDGKEVSLDVPAFINGARTYVPLRFIGEALGRYVDWDQTERAVYIDTDAVSSTMQMSFGGKTFNVKVVKVFLTTLMWV